MISAPHFVLSKSNGRERIDVVVGIHEGIILGLIQYGSMNYQLDPLAEKDHEVLPGLIWKYTNRVLVLSTYACPSECNFCFRKALNQERQERASVDEMVAFIQKHSQIQEVIFSGGEPLLVMDDLTSMVTALARTKHIQLFRIHTRLPLTFPHNVPLEQLVALPRLIHQPFYMVIHTNHPAELEKLEAQVVIRSLRQAGYIMLSHTVFLQGINDSVDTLEALFTKLVILGVKPYYIFHCDHMPHTERFEVPIEKEVAIMSELRKRVSGLAYPLHVIDSFSGKGKIPVPTDYWEWKSGTYTDFAGILNHTLPKRANQ